MQTRGSCRTSERSKTTVGMLGALTLFCRALERLSFRDWTQRYSPAQPENDAHRAHGLVRVHFRRAGPAVLEKDWRLADLAAKPVAAPDHLLLERVAARNDGVEVEFFQLAHTVAAEGAAGIACRH